MGHIDRKTSLKVLGFGISKVMGLAEANTTLAKTAFRAPDHHTHVTHEN